MLFRYFQKKSKRYVRSYLRKFITKIVLPHVYRYFKMHLKNNSKFELIHSSFTGTVLYLTVHTVVQKISNHQDWSIRTVRTLPYYTDTNLFNLIFFQKIDTIVLNTYRTVPYQNTSNKLLFMQVVHACLSDSFCSILFACLFFYMFVQD